ncbi:hypothetical protein QUF99_14925 [Bacillus sp. DX4.1]|uniref:hypothetical protein n=1 Tax=Bacillus sp. DX4.1 TaxID=3055867 RepID=UPI0025A17061|nr:hypothetical protein [Bacillus sp. DX4.1]MDM5188562.1 hypothetical protein [Bacillus sp. DX4.1]
MYPFFSRIAVVAPAAPSVHIAPVHTASSDVGVQLPAVWQPYQLSGQTPSFWHHGTPPGSTYPSHTYPHYPTYAAPQFFYHFPSIYFQNFYGTFNI